MMDAKYGALGCLYYTVTRIFITSLQGAALLTHNMAGDSNTHVSFLDLNQFANREFNRHTGNPDQNCVSRSRDASVASLRI